MHLSRGAIVTVGPEIDPKRARPRPFVIAWLAMIVLAGISLWTAFLGLGHWAPIVQFGIAAIQTAILFILFMRLKGPPSLKWVFAVTGFFWLSFLYGLSMTDYADRASWPPISNRSETSRVDHQNAP
jgi:cytochrome c oxidase subunit 4